MENDYQLLIRQFLQNEISEADMDRLIELLKQSDENKQEFLRLRNFYLSDLYRAKHKDLQNKTKERLQKIMMVLNSDAYDKNNLKTNSKIIHLFKNKRLQKIAAVIIPFIIFSIIFWQLNDKFQQKKLSNNIISNKNNPSFSLQQKAVLTLSNGETVMLDSNQNKIIANNANVQLLNKNGSVIYKLKNNKVTEITYNTISTIRGGQYRLVLADGTNVWLNALSSITYPVAFRGNERIVKLTGEAYFEVAKNAKMPFKVISNNQTIEVLGTHFNVNGYNNETSMNTTLIEGRVKVTTNKGTLVLLPGQQSQVNTDGNVHLESRVNIARIMAWRNGILTFNNSGITDIVHQLERWFDFEIKVDGNFSGRKFSGNIPRNISLNELQRLFEVNKISCCLQKNSSRQTLIISPLK